MQYIERAGKDLTKAEKFMVIHGKSNKLKDFQMPCYFNVTNYCIIVDDADDEFKKLVLFTDQGMVSTSSKVVISNIGDFWDFTTDPETSDGEGRIGFERRTSKNGTDYINLFIE